MPHHRHRFRAVSACFVVWAASSAISAQDQPDARRRADLLAELNLPKPVELPRPQGAIVVPDDATGDAPILVRLSQQPPGPLSVRRAGNGDGRLYLGIRSADRELSGTAEISRGEGKKLQGTIANGELWLSMPPRLGKVTIRVASPAAADAIELVSPTTLVEVRGRQIFLNGEPFLIKGATCARRTRPTSARSASTPSADRTLSQTPSATAS